MSVVMAEEPATEAAPEEQLGPEQQLLADEATGIQQLTVGNPKRHSTTPAMSDFTGITNATAFLASLVRWHACGIVNGQIANDGAATDGVKYRWGLTRLGQLFQLGNPTISGLSPATAVHGTAQITVTVNGAGFGQGAVVQAGGVALATTFVNSGQLTALYTPPAAAGTVQFTVVNPNSAGISPSSPFTVT